MNSRKQCYKVAFPFSNGDYYIEVREGKRFISWLTNERVPDDLRHWTIREGGRWDSVRCSSKDNAKALARELALRLDTLT